MEEGYTIALLVDSDNISADYYDALMSELLALGNVTYKRVYGNFSLPNSKSWGELIVRESLTPIQIFSPVKKKNATDMFMAIDAMDILYSNKVNAFCLATSDSDFTRLALRLKEASAFVVGAGSNVTPESFVKACNRFLMIDELTKSQRPAQKKTVAQKKEEKHIAAEEDKSNEKSVDIPSLTKIKKAVDTIICEQCDPSGEILFTQMITELCKVYPQYNCKLYGAKSSKLFFQKHFQKYYVIEENDKKATIIKMKGL